MQVHMCAPSAEKVRKEAEKELEAVQKKENNSGRSDTKELGQTRVHIQSLIEIIYYSVTYFKRITEFDLL